MGCDIHFFAEHRKDKDSPWEFLPAPSDGRVLGFKEKDSSAHPYRYAWPNVLSEGGYDYWSGEDKRLRDWFDVRNYALFGMLADVRNSFPQGPVAEPRGWPEDCCPELEAERKMIQHTPSWLTVKEMQDYFAVHGTARTEEFQACLEEMVEVSGRDPENIRAVFYFDS